MAAEWRVLVRQGGEALLEGRFRQCERLAGEAARSAPAEAAPGLLMAVACREQGRAVEAEGLVRALLAGHPKDEEAQVLLGAVLADLGRDGEAGRQLDQIHSSGACHRSPAVTALAAEVAAALGSLEHAEALQGPLAGHATAFAGPHGAVSRHLGLVCHVLGRWDQAEELFRVALDTNQAAGAPVLVAHTRRHYSALLRARGDEGDWEHALDLLAQAAHLPQAGHRPAGRRGRGGTAPVAVPVAGRPVRQYQPVPADDHGMGPGVPWPAGDGG